jgi:hypothetical protein
MFFFAFENGFERKQTGTPHLRHVVAIPKIIAKREVTSLGERQVDGSGLLGKPVQF